jgi:hypothetical protein
MLYEGLPPTLATALKEWSVAVRALREGRQILLLRKGGIREAEGEFTVEARDVLLFPTYLHEEEQAGTLQPCYEAWLREEQARKPQGENVRIEAAARITDIFRVTDFDALYRLGSQHIYSEKFVRYRVENDTHKPLYCLFLRVYDLPAPITLPMEMDYYGCKSWITLAEPIATEGAIPAMSDAAYAERVRLTRSLLLR